MPTPMQPGETPDQYKLRLAHEMAQQGMRAPAAQGAPAAPAAVPGMATPPPGGLNGASPGVMNSPAGAVQAQQQAMQPNSLGVDPRAMSAMLGTYGNQLELGALDKQLAQAEALRDAPGPEGRQAGRTFVAANPLEFLGAGIKQYKAGKEAKELKKQTGELRGKIGENVRRYGGALFGPTSDPNEDQYYGG